MLGHCGRAAHAALRPTQDEELVETKFSVKSLVMLIELSVLLVLQKSHLITSGFMALRTGYLWVEDRVFMG